MTTTLHPSVLWAMGGIVVVLVVATTTIWIIDLAKPGMDLGELRARIRSWWVMAAVFFVALAFTKKISLVFFALVSFLALKEYLSLLPDRPKDKTLLVLAYASETVSTAAALGTAAAARKLSRVEDGDIVEVELPTRLSWLRAAAAHGALSLAPPSPPAPPGCAHGTR